MKLLSKLSICLTLISCSNSDKDSRSTIETDSTDYYSDYWFSDSRDIDSSIINELTRDCWLLYETDIIPDSIEVIDLSKSKGLLFEADTSRAKKTVIKFNSDFTIVELNSSTRGKWNIIHKKNIYIKWDRPIESGISGQYSISHLKKQRLHLFRCSNKKKNKTKYIFWSSSCE